MSTLRSICSGPRDAHQQLRKRNVRLSAMMKQSDAIQQIDTTHIPNAPTQIQLNTHNSEHTLTLPTGYSDRMETDDRTPTPPRREDFEPNGDSPSDSEMSEFDEGNLRIERDDIQMEEDLKDEPKVQVPETRSSRTTVTVPTATMSIASLGTRRRSTAAVAPASVPLAASSSPAAPVSLHTRTMKRRREEEEESDDEGEVEPDEDDESSGYTSSSQSDADHAADVEDEDDQPIAMLTTHATTDASKAKAKTPRAPRAKKSATSSKKKKSTGAISRNYVRHDTHRKNGIKAGPKSGKALRKQRWREIQGIPRRKSKKEWAAENEAKLQAGLYCEMMQPKELKHIIEKGVPLPSDANDGGGGTDDEMDALREFERTQFGVGAHADGEDEEEMKDPNEQKDATIDPLSPEAEQAERTRKAILAQSQAAKQARAKVSNSGYTDQALLNLLRSQFKYQEFRPGQLETIQRILSSTSSNDTIAWHGQNVLSILPTGGGKSLIYQMLSLILPGLTLIISPLLSLMKDQLEHLPPFLRGKIWSSEQTPKGVLETMQDLEHQRIKILFISPEKLLTQGFQRFMLDSVINKKSLAVGGVSTKQPHHAGISLVVIDEVHCVSEWSHNFRNAYARLDHVLKDVLHVPKILGLTATATQSTQKQVCASLHIPEENIVKVNLARENLILSTSRVRHEDRFSSLVELLGHPPFKGLKSIIVYVNYKSISEALCKYLKQQGFPSCDYYHAGLPLYQRHKIQTKFMENKLKLLIATCAFGMGLDKPDIRGVIHFNLPRSFENYIQEIGRAGRDGELAYAHVMWSECDQEISGSLVYSNGVDEYQLRRLLNKVFDDAHRIRPRSSLLTAESAGMVVDEEDEPLFLHKHYVALEVEPLRVNMELSEEVVGTILARLERTLGQQWIKLVASIHNQASIAFHKGSPKVLALSSGVIRNLLEQNHWLPRTSRLEKSGVSFDHERAATQFDAQQLAASNAAGSIQPDFNSAEFQQLKQQKGRLNLDLCQAAMECGMDITDVQRALVRLKAAGEISINWSNMSFVVQVLRWPTDDEGSSMIQPSAADSSTTLGSIITELHSYLNKQESMASEKLSIMAQALRMATLPTMRCTPKDAVQRAARMIRQRLKYQKEQSSKTSGLDATTAPIDDEDDDAFEFFDLHKVMELYFSAEDPTEFLEQLRTQCTSEEEKMRNDADGSVTQHSSSAAAAAATMIKKPNEEKILREFEEDVRLFIRSHGDTLASGRELARILHGQKAPSHAAVSRATMHRDRKQNGPSNEGEDERASFGVSPFASHVLWGRYKSLEFPKVLARCEHMLQEWHATASARHAVDTASIEKRRQVKRQKIEEAVASRPSTIATTSTRRPTTVRTAAIPPLHTSSTKLPSRALAASRTPTATAPVTFSTRTPPAAPKPLPRRERSLEPEEEDEIVIPASDDEE